MNAFVFVSQTLAFFPQGPLQTCMNKGQLLAQLHGKLNQANAQMLQMYVIGLLMDKEQESVYQIRSGVGAAVQRVCQQLV